MIKTGFKTAGLFPLNRAAVYWEKLAPGSLHAEKTPKGETMVVTDKMAAVIELSDEMAGNMDLTDEVAGDIELMVQGEAREDVVEEDAPGSVFPPVQDVSLWAWDCWRTRPTTNNAPAGADIFTLFKNTERILWRSFQSQTMRRRCTCYRGKI